MERIYNKSKKVTKISNNIQMIEYENETMLVVIRNKSNVFSITRQEFDIIEKELLDYDFYLLSELKKEAYYIKIKEPNNWIRNAFERSSKDKIFFGKEVLNNKVDEKELEELIGKIGR